MTPEARTEIILRALEAEDANPRAERHLIPWKDGKERCTAIEVDLGVVLLNPRSHRIRAQLDSHSQRALVDSDPWSEKSQELLADLLRRRPGYEDLKANLAADGQLDPGVITRAGVLVNANRRAVALRDLEKKYIRTMVLPEGAATSHISELELRLQVREDLREEYSYTNELLFIKECADSGWSIKRISRELGYASSLGEGKGDEKVTHQLRMLATIQELRAMSNHRLAYDSFDEMKQAMIDLDQAYEKLKKQDVAGATRLRTARIVGVLTGMYYRDLRNVDAEFVDSYLRPELEDDDALGPYLKEFESRQPVDPVGNDLLGGDDGGEGDLASGLLDWLTTTAGHANVSVYAGSTKITQPRSEIVDALRIVMSSASEAAKADRSREDLVERPVRRLKEARQRVQGARDAFKKARSDPRMSGQLGSIEYHLSKLGSDLQALRDTVGEASRSKDK